jgi:hypothetical protein
MFYDTANSILNAVKITCKTTVIFLADLYIDFLCFMNIIYKFIAIKYIKLYPNVEKYRMIYAYVDETHHPYMVKASCDIPADIPVDITKIMGAFYHLYEVHSCKELLKWLSNFEIYTNIVYIYIIKNGEMKKFKLDIYNCMDITSDKKILFNDISMKNLYKNLRAVDG